MPPSKPSQIDIEKNEQMRVLFEYSPLAIALVDLDGNFVRFNQKVIDLFGYSAEELSKQKAIWLTKGEDVDLTKEKIAQLRNGQLESFSVEKRFEKKCGETFWGEITVTLVTDEQGRPQYTIGMIQDINTRKTAEFALQNSEARYLKLYDNSPDMFASVDFESNKITQCNKTFAAKLGYTKEEVVGKQIFDFYPPDVHDEIRETRRLFLETGLIENKERQFICKDGTMLDVLINVIGIRNDEGEIVDVIRTCHDISSLKKAERARLASEESYADLYENAPDMYALVDFKTSTILKCNQTFAGKLGFSKEELIGQKIYSFYHYGPGDQKAVEKSRSRYSETGKLNNIERRLICKDGSIIDVLIKIRADYDENGKIISSRCVYRDISERKKTQEDLDESKRNFQNLFDHSPLGMGISTPDGVYLQVNKKLANMLGYEPSELVGKRFYDVTHPEDREITKRKADEIKSRDDHNEWISYEKRYVRKNGTVFWIRLIGSVVHNQKKGESYLIGLVEDITESRQMLAAMEETEQFNASILAAGINGVFIYDLNLRQDIYLNSRYTELTGYTHDDIQSMSKEEFLELFDPLEAESFDEHFEEIEAAKDGEIIELEYKFKRANGTWMWCVSWEVVLKRNKNGVPVQTVGTFLDITTWREAEEILQNHKMNLEKEVRSRTQDLNKTIQLMAGREIRMAELKKALKLLRSQLIEAGLEPVAHDSLAPDNLFGRTN